MLMCLCPIGAMRLITSSVMIAWRPVDRRLEVMGVPGHDDVREQRECPRYGAELLRRAAVLRGDHPVVDRPLEAVDGLALIEQIEHVGRGIPDCSGNRRDRGVRSSFPKASPAS